MRQLNSIHTIKKGMSRLDLPLLKPVTCCSFLLEQPCRRWTHCRKRSYGTNISHYVTEIPAKLHQTAAILANMWPLRKSKMNHSLEPFGTNDPIEAKSSTSATVKKTTPTTPATPSKEKNDDDDVIFSACARNNPHLSVFLHN